MLLPETPDLSYLGSPGNAIYTEQEYENDIIDTDEQQQQEYFTTVKIGEILKLCQINVEGLTRSKSEFLDRLLYEEHCDVILMQETHVTDQNHLERVSLFHNYSCVDSIFHRHHGLATFVKNELLEQCVIISKSVVDDIETLVIKINNIHVTNIYKPPSIKWVSAPAILPHPSVYLGDFNSHHSLWGYNTSDSNGEFIINWALENNLHLMYDAKDHPTFTSGRWRSGTNPDLCFVSSDEFLFSLPSYKSVGPVLPNSQHRPIFLEIGVQIPSINSYPAPRWNFKKANWTAFAKSVDMNIRWIKPIKENYDRFVGVMLGAAKRSIPRGYRKNYIPTWNSECEDLWQTYKATGSGEVASQLLLCLNKGRTKRWQKLVEDMDFTHSSRKAWDLLRKLGSAKRPSHFVNAISPNKIASKVLSNSKIQVPTKMKSKINARLQKIRKKLRESPYGYPVTVGELEYAMRNLKTGKAAGCDGLFPEFFVHLGKNAKLWLTRLFSSCFVNGKIPKIWKKSTIKAILKPGKERNAAENYRPIALLCICYKILERIIYNRIIDVVDPHIPVEQAGFRENRNCCDQVLSLTTFIESGFQDKVKTSVVFIDLSSAYDTVWKKGLLFKLAKILRCKATINLIDEFLTNRSFILYAGNKKSKRRFLDNGLPQGSVLAPLLFNVYTSDLTKTNSRKFIYADDLALAFQYNYDPEAEREGIAIIEKDLELLDKYYSDWGLRPNPNKCEVLTCHLSNFNANTMTNIQFRGNYIPYNFTPKYLGVTLDRGLTYKNHCQKLRDKIRSRNNIIHQLSGSAWGATANVLRISSLALVYSAAEYCAPVWGDSAHVRLIDVQLNCTMRIITGTLKSTELSWLPILANIAPTRIRREAALAHQVAKIKENENLPIHHDLQNRLSNSNRLVSRYPLWTKIENLGNPINSYSIEDKWLANFNQIHFANKYLITTPYSEVAGFHEVRSRWVTLNRIRTNVGRCNHTLHKWYPNLYSPCCECGDVDQTIAHIVDSCPLRRFEGGLVELHQLSERSLHWIDSIDIQL